MRPEAKFTVGMEAVVLYRTDRRRTIVDDGFELNDPDPAAFISGLLMAQTLENPMRKFRAVKVPAHYITSIPYLSILQYCISSGFLSWVWVVSSS